MAAPFQAGPAEGLGTPVRLFAIPERANGIFADATPHGQRFLLNVPTTARTSIGFHAIRD